MDNPNRQLVPVPPMPAPVAPAVIDDGFIKSRIFTIRGMQVMLDRDLAVIYGVETKALNQAVKRNAERFPESFMFRLSSAEAEKWKSQIVTSNLTPKEEVGLRMGLRRPPHAFTEQGIAMLSAVLKSRTAILVSIRIMEIFVAMRRAFVSMAPMLARLDTSSVARSPTRPATRSASTRSSRRWTAETSRRRRSSTTARSTMRSSR